MVKDVCFSNPAPLAIIAGPCVIEGLRYEQGLDFALKTAETLKKICFDVDLPLVYKSSFDKANRTSPKSYRGPGLDVGLKILQKVKTELELPIVTDVHEVGQVKAVAEVADLMQTPAFLCRQTDFIQAVAAAGKPVNIKKGQFLAPQDMAKVAQKAQQTGNDSVMLCDRGYAFGYGNLIVDMRGLVVMSDTGFPVIFDATHSVQQPGGLGESSGGERQFVAPLARAAVSVGVAGLFLETHADPDNAPCDGPNMLAFEQLPEILSMLKRLDEVRKE
ncbi:MAG: 3-deoxy-8-phosphooctulonate synthase [Magnetococcales bacterium]|nr:3-deoxy-8-phosphooctulonate synthase [Magnetococcales bacterium]